MTSDLLAAPAEEEGTAAEVASRPRVLLVGRTRYQLPLNPSLRPKFDALRRALDLRVLASAAAPPASAKPESFELVAPFTPAAIDGVAFYAGLPFRIAREQRRFEPDAIIAQSPY